MSEKIDNSKTVQIYGPGFSNFVRSVALICEQHGVAYTLGFELDGNPIEFKSEQHFDLHPYGKMPVLKHGELILPETASICRYIQSTLANNVQERPPQQSARIDAFSALASIYINQAIMRSYILEFAIPKGENGEIRLDVAKQAQPDVRNALSVIDKELATSDTLNDDNFSIADAIILPMLFYISTLPEPFNLLTEYPKVNEYLNSMMELEICQKILVPLR